MPRPDELPEYAFDRPGPRSSAAPEVGHRFDTADEVETCVVCEVLLTRDRLVVSGMGRSSAGMEFIQVAVPLCASCRERVEADDHEALQAVAAALSHRAQDR